MLYVAVWFVGLQSTALVPLPLAPALDQPAEQSAELAVEHGVEPHAVSPANAGAEPVRDPELFAAFGGHEGITRIVDGMVARVSTDPLTAEIFAAADLVHSRRMITEQFCYLLGGPCVYTGRDMASVHRDHGITAAEFNVMVESLQLSMDAQGVPFRVQGRLLARLAPMRRMIVTR